MKRAVSPEEIQKIVKKKKVIPDFIFEIFNELRKDVLKRVSLFT